MIRDYAISSGECFGHYKVKSCGNCIYGESCRLVSAAPNPDFAGKIRNPVSIEKNTGRIHSEHTPIMPKFAENFTDAAPGLERSDLAEVLLYLLALDDNTLSLLQEIIANPALTQSELARKRGVSRQRINTALLHACKKNPELENLFALTLKKMTISKNRYKKKPEQAKAL